MSRSEIRRQVSFALRDRDAVAYLFGSYARGEATAKSDVDLLVVEKKPSGGWMYETALLRRRLDFGRPVDLVLVDEASYDEWKDVEGSVQHEVAKEGERLV